MTDVTPEDARHVVRRVVAILVVEGGPENARDATVEEAARFFRAAGGEAEPASPQRVVALFEDATEAAVAVTRFHAGREPPWRAGLHAGETLMTADAAAARAAIEQAGALARRARPGTTAATADAIMALGPLRGAAVEALEGTVRLLVPRPAAAALRERRATIVFLGVAALGGLAGGAAWLTTGAQGDRERRLTLGVGPFRAAGPNAALAWIGPALRDGLNAQLSELTGVQVFSDEFMDFIMNRENLTSIEVAQRLGIEKMVSGSVVVVGDTVRIEARIIDVASGILEGAYSSSGREQDFLTLERDLVFGVVAKLALPLTPEDEARLATGRTTNADALRRLLDAEGAPQIEAPAPATPPEPQSWNGLGPTSAHAAEAEANVLALLEQYRAATERRDVGAVAALYVELSEPQRAALERFFANVRDLRVGIDRVSVVVVGDEAVVSYTRTDDFIDVPTSRPQQVSVRLTKSLVRVGGQWRFTAGR